MTGLVLVLPSTALADPSPVAKRAVAERGKGRRWRAVVPRGLAFSGLSGAGIPGRPPEPAPIAGDAARFRIAVYAYQGSRFTLRELGGRYRDA